MGFGVVELSGVFRSVFTRVDKKDTIFQSQSDYWKLTGKTIKTMNEKVAEEVD